MNRFTGAPLPAWAIAGLLVLCLLLCGAGGLGLLYFASRTAPVPTATPLPTWTATSSSPFTTSIPSPTAVAQPQVVTVTPMPTQIPSPTTIPTRPPSVTFQATAFGYPAATVAAAWVDVWDDPAHKGDPLSLQTQLVTGERVVITGETGDGYWIIAVEQPSSKHDLGYPGWVRQDGLVPDWAIAEQYVVVMSGRAAVHAGPDSAAETLLWLSLDSRLPALAESGDWVQVRLPDDRRGWVSRSSTRLTVDPDAPAETDCLVETATSLLGTPYRWGGTTSDSFDCSGFVYRVFHAHGINLARDSRDQATGGRPVAPDALAPGDLIFTAAAADRPVSHVAIYVGGGQILDCGTEGAICRSLEEVLEARVWKGARAYLR